MAIFSNGYDFQLDSTKPLGMVCPTILETPNDHEKEDMTVFVLFLSLNDQQFEELKQKLAEMNGETLLFLRRLCCIDIWFGDERLVCHECSITDDSVATIVTRRNIPEHFEYILHKVMWEDLPHHELRVGGISEVILAFPFDSNGPVIKNQNIFAFLPVQATFFPVISSIVPSDDSVPCTCRFSHPSQSRGHKERGGLESRIG